jgi:ElaB/YqjD/DUF883 family membrane-anchored ribosome-binding protein
MSEETAKKSKEGPASTNVSETLESSKSHALQAAEELRAAAAQKAKELKDVALDRTEHLRSVADERARQFRDTATEKAEHYRDYAEERWSDAQGQFDDLKSEGERYVRANPAKSVLIALGLGIIIGRILR